MKLSRFLLLAGAALAVLLLAAVALAFNARVQTGIAHRVLASHPGLGVTLGSVSAGPGRVEVRNLRVATRGAVLTLPALDADLPLVSAGLRHKILVTRLVAKGWTLDLSKARPLAASTGDTPAPSRAREFSLLSSAFATDNATAAAVAPRLFQGLFAQLQLPVDLTLDGVDLVGDVILPDIDGHSAGRVRVTLAGGGLAAGASGTFALALDAEASATGAPVNSLALRATVLAAMDTPRTFTRVTAKADASATGPNFPRGVKLAADLAATRTDAGENYTVTLATEDKQLLAAQAALAKNAGKLDGTWKLDMHDTDLAPFALGRRLPVFAATGDGRFDTEATFDEIHAVGRLHAGADSLAVIKPELAAMGAVRLDAEFDVARRGDTTRVERLSVAVDGAQPVVSVESLQAFAFTLKDGKLTELHVADPARDLLGIVLHGLPLAWAQPFLKNFTLAGGDLRGEFAASARNGGFALRAKTPLTAGGISLAQAGRPLLQALDFSLDTSAVYTPAEGWQIDAAPLTLASGGATLLFVQAKAGQLAGQGQPIKSAGNFSTNLPVVLAQPMLHAARLLTSGGATGDFAASLGATQQIQLKLAVANLVADPKRFVEKLPTITADVRADIAADGQITLNAPLLLERDGRKSDLAIAGTLTRGKAGFAVDARVTSALLVADDAKILAALAAPPSSGPPATAPITAKSAPRDNAPPWAGLTGQLALALKKVVYADSFQANDITGAFRVDAGTLYLDNLSAGLGDGGNAKVFGAVTFDAKSANPYALAAELTVNEFDPAPLFKSLNPGQPATVEGKFTVASKLAGLAPRLGDLATATHGDFQLTSKGGVFRGLPVNVATKTENLGKLAAGVALVGSALDVFKGRKDDSDITNLAQAVSEFSKMLAAIQYDQLSFVLTRDAALNTVLKDFTLISPDIRLTGGGQATHQAGLALLEEALAMEFKLRARGHTADLLKFLGKLDATPDDLGYSACTLPLKVGGTLGKPDTSELNNAIASLALEKSGMTDKALDLLNKLIPRGK